MNTTATTDLAALLASPLKPHEMNLGPITHQPEGCPATYTFHHLFLDLGGVKIGIIEGDSRARKTPGYPHASIPEAEAIRAEIIRRWNAFPALREDQKRLDYLDEVRADVLRPSEDMGPVEVCVDAWDRLNNEWNHDKLVRGGDRYIRGAIDAAIQAEASK